LTIVIYEVASNRELFDDVADGTGARSRAPLALGGFRDSRAPQVSGMA
jgi:hypothetical protein